ncbi:MAG: DUF1292 domain-containing protein, partial [Clostridia bacterium]|nr:DUF1292 domain-containing protein [Clostridia bacterium]
MAKKDKDDEELDEKDFDVDPDAEPVEDDEDDGIITLLDEDNNMVSFRFMDVTVYEGKNYVLLVPAEPMEGYDENDVVIMEYNEKESTMTAVDDDEYAQKIFDAYNEEMDEEELFAED